jgi:hypothetical protein
MKYKLRALRLVIETSIREYSLLEMERWKRSEFNGKGYSNY